MILKYMLLPILFKITLLGVFQRLLSGGSILKWNIPLKRPLDIFLDVFEIAKALRQRRIQVTVSNRP
jgi:hypothetical protein